ncbi:MAG: response regulator [Balneolaceae bacterium]|nr:response regulator [Balneolaceae bacterium]
MDYTILIIDDDEPMHIISKNLLGDEFNLIHAKNAQEGIDVLSENAVNLIMSDIHMPGISGLEFLESLMQDAQKKEIPVLVITNLPTVEKEKKALELGAADFIEKTMFIDKKEKVKERVRMKLVTNVKIPYLTKELAMIKKKLVSKLMSEAVSGGFSSTIQKLSAELRDLFSIDCISFWIISGEQPRHISTYGQQLPDDYSSEELKKEYTYQQILDSREPYMTNHVFNDELGVMSRFSEEHNLPAEIGIPMFALDERELLINDMKIPDDAKMFAYLILKRNKLFSSKEFDVISRLLTQTGSIFWRLYKNKQ